MKKKETYEMSRSRLLSYIIPKFSNLDLPLVNEGQMWHHYYGFSKEPIPSVRLCAPY